MIYRLIRPLGSTALAATLSLTGASLAFGGDDNGNYHQRGTAICSPLEAPDQPSKHYLKKGLFVPYYGSPLTPISTRWRSTDCHGNVIAVPYYCGYCKSDKHAVYGSAGPEFDAVPGPGFGNFGPFTGAPDNEAALLHLGGNGFLDYKAGPPDRSSAPDIVNAIEGRRQGEACPP